MLTQALVTEGSLIRPGQKLGEFINPSIYELEVAVNKSYSDFMKIGEQVRLLTLDGTRKLSGKVSRINAAVNQDSQTVTIFIDVQSDYVKEGMFLEALIEGRNEENSLEVPRTLITEQKEIFIVRDSVLDVIKVNPVFYTDKTAVIRGVEDGTVILSRPVPGAHPGMLVRPYNDSTLNRLSAGETTNPLQQ